MLRGGEAVSVRQREDESVGGRIVGYVVGGAAVHRKRGRQNTIDRTWRVEVAFKSDAFLATNSGGGSKIKIQFQNLKRKLNNKRKYINAKRTIHFIFAFDFQVGFSSSSEVFNVGVGFLERAPKIYR